LKDQITHRLNYDFFLSLSHSLSLSLETYAYITGSTPCESNVINALSTQSHASMFVLVNLQFAYLEITLDIPKITNLIVAPKDESVSLTSSRKIRDMLERTLKPSDFNLKVRKISSTRNNGVRIEAHSVNLNKMKNTQVLDKTELRLEQEIKTNPRFIVFHAA